MVKGPSTIEAQYVSNTVGPALAMALAEIVEKRPVDPIEYLANYLNKYSENTSQRKKDADLTARLEQLKVEEELNKQRQEEMRKEIEQIQQMEEKMKKEKEAEEKAKREAEELAKRKQELASIPPPLPAVKEEEEVVAVDFGETKLHQAAAVPGANLTQLLKEENINLAVRNSQNLTARDIAEQNGLAENVKQIDDFVCELVVNEDYKALHELVVNGFTNVIDIVEVNLGNAEQMETKDMRTQAEQVYTVIPELMEKIQKIKEAIEKNDLRLLQMQLDRRSFAFYRDEQGRSSIHLALEKLNFDVALYLVEKYPSLGKINDCQGRHPIDYLEATDKSTINERQQQQYDQLLAILKV